jgi:hypothetical protein rflaF_14162
MQIKTHKFFSQKLSLLAPVLVFFFSITSIFALILLTSNNSTFAAPGAGGTPRMVSVALDAMNVDFHFTPAELSASTFKQGGINASISTDNPTGFTFYVSSIDEDTNLNHTDTSVTTKITSITSPLVESNFTPKSWGYSADGVNFKPIPKASVPDTVLTTTNTTGQRARVDFGVKASPDLNSGTYSKQVLFTAVTNAVPKIAIFKTGYEVSTTIHNLNPAHNTDSFRHSPSAPTNLGSTTVVSANDSPYPIFMWYDSTDKSIYWWSEAEDVYASVDARAMFSSINSVTSNSVSLIDTRGINFSKTKNMSSMFFSYSVYKKIILDNMDTSAAEDMSGMFQYMGTDNTPAEGIDISSFNTSKVKNMKDMFSGSMAATIKISGIDTSNVENMDSMFSSLKNVKELDLSNIDVRKVTSVYNIFYSNTALTSLNLSNWHPDSLTSFNVLNFLPKLKSLNLSGFSTKNFTSMSFMFSSDSMLESLDLSSFDTSSVTTMKGMFSGLASIKSLTLSNFDTRNVIDMANMFYWMKEISSLDLSNFNTEKVTDMSGMFGGMLSLKNLNISSFDTKNVTTMANMFANTMLNSLNNGLDLSSFSSQKLVNTERMFAASSYIKTIYTSLNFNLDSVTRSSDMFLYCTKLRGGNGTTYSNSNPTDKTYARIDAPGTPGYFTLKP